MAFGEKLQEVRKQSGMTQETFAEQLHVSRQAVSRWESGRGYPEIEKILYIMDNQGAEYYKLNAGTTASLQQYYYIGEYMETTRPRALRPVSATRPT